MPYLLVVCYFTPAKPQSGYSAAVRGYAQKLAGALGYEARSFSQEMKNEPQTPEITIGLEDIDWAGGPPLLELKARPYADQHGQGPSMHGLTEADLAQAKKDCRWRLNGPVGLVLVANPPWLATQPEYWAAKLNGWAKCNGLGGLIISNSPRTNPLLWEQWVRFSKETIEIPVIFIEVEGGRNDYLAALALADAVCILGSSRSMAGEAALTGAPIAYKADDAASEAAFFAAAQDQLGHEAERFVAFSHSEPIGKKSFLPLDVTRAYVNEVLARLHHVRKEAGFPLLRE